MRFAITILTFCVAALVVLGLVMLYSSSMTQVGTQLLVRQACWCALGLVGCVVAARLDYAVLQRCAWLLYGLSVLVLVLVLVPHVGVKINGARRWLGVGEFRIQPAEFAKLALILALAWYGERYQRQMVAFRKGLLIPSLFCGVVLVLIFAEPDVGTTVLTAAVAGCVLLVAGVPWRYVLPPGLAGLAGVAAFVWQDPVRAKRIFAWLYLEENKLGVGFQAYQAMLALGSGGWTGLGLGNGRQKLGFVPYHYTDFIFSMIGEELGLVATLLVVAAFVAIVLCGLYISLNAREPFGLLLGCGITFLIGLQAFINIGVVTSALPNKGLPLPFISYGGSSLLVLLTCVGVLLSIARHARIPARRSGNPFQAEPPSAPQYA